MTNFAPNLGARWPNTMPTKTYIQSATWPGVAGVASAIYVCSHGIGPSTAQIVTFPQYALPEKHGDLVFFDGTTTITIPDCLVDQIAVKRTRAGRIYTLDILDRRWRWLFGA